MLRGVHCAYKVSVSAPNYPSKCTVISEKQLAVLQDQSHNLVTGTHTLSKTLTALLFHSIFYM